MVYPIYVTYTPQTDSDHRICYKLLSGPGPQQPIGPDPDFCCMLDSTPSIPGTPKTFTIANAGVTACTDGIPNTPITPVGQNAGEWVYTGYVQPVCDEAGIFKTNWEQDVTFIVVG
jgi:hypothetical protein